MVPHLGESEYRPLRGGGRRPAAAGHGEPAGLPWELVATGIEDLQVQYTQADVRDWAHLAAAGRGERLEHDRRAGGDHAGRPQRGPEYPGRRRTPPGAPASEASSPLAAAAPSLIVLADAGSRLQ